MQCSCFSHLQNRHNVCSEVVSEEEPSLIALSHKTTGLISENMAGLRQRRVAGKNGKMDGNCTLGIRCD